MPQGIEPTSSKLNKWVATSIRKKPTVKERLLSLQEKPTTIRAPSVWDKLADVYNTVMTNVGKQPAMQMTGIPMKPIMDAWTNPEVEEVGGTQAGIFPPELIGIKKTKVLDMLADFEKTEEFQRMPPEDKTNVSNTLLEAYSRYPRAMSRLTDITAYESKAKPGLLGEYYDYRTNKSATNYNKGIAARTPTDSNPFIKEVLESATTPEELANLMTSVGGINMATPTNKFRETIFHELGHSAVNMPIKTYNAIKDKVGYYLHPEEIGARGISLRKRVGALKFLKPGGGIKRSWLQEYVDRTNASLKISDISDVQSFEKYGVPELNKKFGPTLKSLNKEIAMGHSGKLVIRDSYVPQSYDEIGRLMDEGRLTLEEANNLVDKYFPEKISPERAKVKK
jgi:hypothetical protein